MNPYEHSSGCLYDEEFHGYDDIDYGDDGIEGSGESVSEDDDCE